MYIIGLIILTFFALIGILAFINSIIKLRDPDRKATMILSDLSAGDAEMRIRRAARICSEIRCERLICMCADADSLFICKALSAVYPVIEARKAEDDPPLSAILYHAGGS